MADITSNQNAKVKDWKKLHTRKERKKTQTYMVEGFHLVEEAIKFKKDDILHIIMREDLVNHEDVKKLEIARETITTITDNVANELSETETNQGIFSILKMSKTATPSKIEAPYLLLDAVQDPGNVGTMIRTADAAGFQGVILGTGTVDLYNAKTIRSAQGSHFHLEVLEGSLAEFITNFKEKNVTILGTALNEKAESYKDLHLEGPFGLIVGNEGAGISDEILTTVDHNIYIPMKGQAESLNVAIAASIMMFHLY